MTARFPPILSTDRLHTPLGCFGFLGLSVSQSRHGLTRQGVSRKWRQGISNLSTSEHVFNRQGRCAFGNDLVRDGVRIGM
jgi:hypothetical protein